jgi:hypothetical protein
MQIAKYLVTLKSSIIEYDDIDAKIFHLVFYSCIIFFSFISHLFFACCNPFLHMFRPLQSFSVLIVHLM